MLTRLARDVPIIVEEIGLGSDTGHRLAVENGVLFAPGVLLDDRPFGYGWLSERKLRKALTRTPHAENQTV